MAVARADSASDSAKLASKAPSSDQLLPSSPLPLSNGAVQTAEASTTAAAAAAGVQPAAAQMSGDDRANLSSHRLNPQAAADVHVVGEELDARASTNTAVRPDQDAAAKACGSQQAVTDRQGRDSGPAVETVTGEEQDGRTAAKATDKSAEHNSLDSPERPSAQEPRKISGSQLDEGASEHDERLSPVPESAGNAASHKLQGV